MDILTKVLIFMVVLLVLMCGLGYFVSYNRTPNCDQNYSVVVQGMSGKHGYITIYSAEEVSMGDSSVTFFGTKQPYITPCSQITVYGNVTVTKLK